MSTLSRLKNLTKLCVPALLVLGTPLTASAHYLWLLPSQFEVSGNDKWITADAAISKVPFHYDALPMPLEGLTVTAPDGSDVKPSDPVIRQRRSLFDVELQQDGVYRLSIHDHALFAIYKADGEVKKWHGSASAFKTAVPANAQDLNVFETDTRLESFVARNQAGAMAPKPTGKGLEIVAQASLDSFKRGGTSSFVVLLDGKPAKDIEVLIASADVSKAAETPLKVRTASDGSFVNHWGEAGSYLLSAQLQDQQATLKPASKRRMMYGLTVSVRSS